MKKKKSKKLKFELYYEKCNPTKEELNKALLDLLIVLGDGERERLLMNGNTLSAEDKKVIQEYNDAIEFLAQVKDNYKEFDSHQGVKNSLNPKSRNNKWETKIYKTFEL